jgi:hypothetical protein
MPAIDAHRFAGFVHRDTARPGILDNTGSQPVMSGLLIDAAAFFRIGFSMSTGWPGYFLLQVCCIRRQQFSKGKNGFCG